MRKIWRFLGAYIVPIRKTQVIRAGIVVANMRSVANVFNSVQIMNRALDYQMKRQNVLASNIANVDTPGYRPREVVRPTESDWQHRLAMAISHPDHFQGVDAQEPGGNVILEERTVQPGLDGNSVSLERETSKMAANDMQYEGVVRMLTHHMGMLRYAANDGSNG